MEKITLPTDKISDYQRILISRYEGINNWNLVRVFDMIVCDNSIIDNQQISTQALFQIRDKLLGTICECGKTWDNKEILVARIFDCCIKCDYYNPLPNGEPRLYIQASAYINTHNYSYSHISTAIENDYYESVVIDCDIEDSFFDKKSNIRTIKSINKIFKWGFSISTDKLNCPLKVDPNLCFGAEYECYNVSKSDCDKYKKIYNLGKQDAYNLRKRLYQQNNNEKEKK